MNGKKAKQLRKLAAKYSEPSTDLVKVNGTSRVVTAGNGKQVVTRTLANKLGSFRNTLKHFKRGSTFPFNPAENAHVA